MWVLQTQRQLQLSLEAHGRYITSLIQKESMEGRQLPLHAQEALEQVQKQGGSGERRADNDGMCTARLVCSLPLTVLCDSV